MFYHPIHLLVHGALKVPAAERPHADVLKVWVAFELVAVESARLCSIENAVAWTVASLGELIGTQ